MANVVRPGVVRTPAVERAALGEPGADPLAVGVVADRRVKGGRGARAAATTAALAPVPPSRPRGALGEDLLVRGILGRQFEGVVDGGVADDGEARHHASP